MRLSESDRFMLRCSSLSSLVFKTIEEVCDKTITLLRRSEDVSSETTRQKIPLQLINTLDELVPSTTLMEALELSCDHRCEWRILL